MPQYYVPIPETHDLEFYHNTQIEPFYTNQAQEHQEFSTEVRSLPGYDRDSLATGVDLKLNPGEDLVLNSNGDLELETGSQLVQNALARRMATPPGGYQRYIYVGGRLENLNEDYGNPLYYMLSQTGIWEQTNVVEQIVKKAAVGEVRVTDVQVKKFYAQPNTGTFTLELHYRIKSNQELYALEMEINGSN